MYEMLEVDQSAKLLQELSVKSRQTGISIAIIGGWATFFYVNPIYNQAFGKPYMGSRDIDIAIKHEQAAAFKQLILDLSYMKNGYQFRWEKIFDRENKIFVNQDEAKSIPPYNLVYIFLDLFCDKATENLYCWVLEPLKGIKYEIVNDYSLADIDTLIALKCVAIFARDKADKENKDACDLYALINYSGRKITHTLLFRKAIEKILSRHDLIYSVSQHVLLDTTKQGIVEHALRKCLANL